MLLTYKGKVLLLQQENILNPQNSDAWHFIKKIKLKDKSAEKTIIQEVERETQVKLDKATFVASAIYNNITTYLFHANLSDQHVNSIERGQGRILQFFDLNEVAQLQMQPSTKLFFSNSSTFKQLPL